MNSIMGNPIKNASQILQLFEPFINELQLKWKLSAVILFGSRARGDFLPHSDYDLIIIADFKESYFKRGDKLLAILPPVGIDFFTYTPQEFQKMFLDGNLTAIDSIKEGIALFDSDFLRPFVRKYKILEKLGIKRGQSSLNIPPLPENEKTYESFI